MTDQRFCFSGGAALIAQPGQQPKPATFSPPKESDLCRLTAEVRELKSRLARFTAPLPGVGAATEDPRIDPAAIYAARKLSAPQEHPAEDFASLAHTVYGARSKSHGA